LSLSSSLPSSSSLSCHSRHCRCHRSHHCRRRSLSRWCHHSRSVLVGRVPTRRRPPPLMRSHHHHRHCHHRRMSIASSTSLWTPLLPYWNTCACSAWKPLDYSVANGIFSVTSVSAFRLYGVAGDHSNEARTTI
jgi:hypothetical protein